MGSVFRFTQAAALCLGTLLMVTGPLPAQDASPKPTVGNPVVDPLVQRHVEDWAIQQRGVPDDWSHHYVVFSNPGTEQQALESGNYEQWLKTVNDPRFTLQQVKRSGAMKWIEGAAISGTNPPGARPFGVATPELGQGGVWRIWPRNPRTRLKKDWAVGIGGVAASGTGTITTNDASAASIITVDGQTFTGSAPTTASATGTFTGAPGAGQSVTLTNGANVLSLTTNATAASAVGTVSGTPTSNLAPTITLTNSAGSSANTLSLTTNGTGGTATGTFSSTGPTNGQTITIQNALNSNTLTLTFSAGAATPGTGTVTVSNSIGTANGDTLTIGSVTYTFEETTTAFPGEPFTGAQYYCQNTTSPCVWWGTTAANQAQAIYAAIINDPTACPPTTGPNPLYGIWQSTCYSYITAPNPYVTATLANPGTGAVVSLINISGSNAPFLTTSSQSAFTLASAAGSTIPANTSGTGTATFSGVAAAGDTITMGATTYTFQTSSLATVGSVLYGASASDSAGNLSAAVNNLASQCVNPAGGPCFNVAGANASVGSSALAGVVTAVNLTNGTVTWSKASSVITLSPAPIPAPTGSCASSTAGALNLNATQATVAAYLAAAVNSCHIAYPAIWVTASASGGIVTITDTTPGSFTTIGTLGGNASN